MPGDLGRRLDWDGAAFSAKSRHKVVATRPLLDGRCAHRMFSLHAVSCTERYESSLNTPLETTIKKMILVGENKIGDGCVHQADFATALRVERLTGWPKDATDVEVIVGKLLANRKPALLIKAEMQGAAIATVADVMTPEVALKIGELLSFKPRLETYEVKALEHLKSHLKPPQKSEPDQTVLADVFAMPDKLARGKGKKKGVAASSRA